MKKLLNIAPFLYVILLQSCALPTYIQTTPNIPLLEDKDDLTVNLLLPLPVQINTYDITNTQLQTAYSPFQNFSAKANVYYAFKKEKNESESERVHNFREWDLNFAIGYYIDLERHNFSLYMGGGFGKLDHESYNLNFFDHHVNRSSFGEYSKCYIQSGYYFKVIERIQLGIGMAYERINNSTFLTSKIERDNTTNTLILNDLTKLTDHKIFSLQPSFVVRVRMISLFYFTLRYGSTNIQNDRNIHRNRTYLQGGFQFVLNRK